MIYARVVDSVVQEVFIVPEGFSLAQCVHPSILNLFEPIPNEVKVGWVKNEDGTFTEPTV